MCGIAGFLDPRLGSDNERLRQVAASMVETLHHRGPDDSGVWTDQESGIALGHKRLSIIDLSPLGHQPMASASGRFQIVYNGEIYNHPELRLELEANGHSFRGHSDTEVLLASIEQWGIEPTLQRMNGMFAFALWDTQQRRLTVARDRIGIKPLYYGWAGDVFVFASELKAIRAHPTFGGEIDRRAIALLLQHCYIPAPYSIYRGIHKLPPGTSLQLDSNGKASAEPVPYWRLSDGVQQGETKPFDGSAEEASRELERRLRDSVRLRMIADVSLGAFLSGGIDSSTVVALMQAESSQAVRTFSIGFHEQQFNEATYASAVAEHLGTEHVEYYVTAREALDVIPELPKIYDEPFADSSQIPTFLVSQIARQHVTVCLSGDGGDELFAGYNRYEHISRIWKKIGWLPAALRFAAATLLKAAFPRRGKFTQGLLKSPNAQAAYAYLNTHWKDLGEVVAEYEPAPTIWDDGDAWNLRTAFVEQMMHLDAMTYLPDDILVKVDRASMAVGLEARVPLLDHRVVEFAWSLPLGLKANLGETKIPLRSVLQRHVPRELFERPKVGFGVPIDQWLRGPLRDWGEELLSADRLQQEGYFEAAPIRQRWSEHLAGTHDWHYWLWDVLMFQAWLEHNR
jgi:asparagine synthase (glutamine-hydrolysing)